MNAVARTGVKPKVRRRPPRPHLLSELQSRNAGRTFLAMKTAFTGRECGECHACCVLPYIRGLRKARNTPCKHLKSKPSSKGCCSIYEDRPPTCHMFECGWKIFPDLFDDSWYPPISHMLISGGLFPLVTCEPQHPDAWRAEPYYSQLLQIVRSERLPPMMIRTGGRTFWLNADGTTEPVK